MRFCSAFLAISLIFSVVSAGSVCINGFTLVNGRCLKLFTTVAQHRVAESVCSSYGGTLVNIKNAIDNRAVFQLVGNTGISYWIGVYFLGSSYPVSCYSDDGLNTAATYSNFARGFPNLDLGGCVYTATSGALAGQWVSSECDDVELAYVCEIPATSADTCSNNYNNYCYLPSHQISVSRASFTKALEVCQQNCANLVSIHSRRELSYIQGLYRQYNIYNVLVGALFATPSTPFWIDQSSWDYDHMNPLNGGNGTCLQMAVKADGTLSHTDCSTNQYFLCKRPTGITCNATPAPPVIVTPTPSNPTGCNSTALFDSGVIKSINYPLPFPSASYCIYNLATLGAYRIGIYFTDFSTRGSDEYVQVYDSNGNLLASLKGSPATRTYFSISNTMTVVMFGGSSVNSYKGFSANFQSF